MNAVEIEEAVSNLVLQPFDGAEFPFSFLTAFDNKETTIKRLRKGETNTSDVPNGVLQRNNIHIAVCEHGAVGVTLAALRNSPKTVLAKAKFILATDGVTFEAEDRNSGETIATTYVDFPKYFGFFLPLAGISTIKEIKNNSIDVKATGHLNKLYVELLNDNPDWSKPERRHDMNHFMARLIFCFFAEDTGIFHGEGVFTATVSRMSDRDSSNTHEIVSTLFHSMNTKPADRIKERIPSWANIFPYVNGGLFSGSIDVPRFSRMARAYFLHAGELNWREINPDIFGSMIQAVADDEERNALGMHYTSVPNILKVLNPLFLDDLRTQLEVAGENHRALLNLRKRMAKIRVFDPACGSGNFLVIAYKQMRAIESEINLRREETDVRTEIPLTNFRGIELRDFPAEIARLALIIAEYQCDVLYRGQKEALAEFLPLDAMNWITCGNALRLDWLSICPPTGTGVKFAAEDLFHTPLDQAQIDFKNEGGETYICGNPPYLGSTLQSDDQKSDLAVIFDGYTTSWKSLDYVAGWFMKAAEYGTKTNATAALVSTNSICQGQQVPILWPLVFAKGYEIAFAYTSFKWTNLASHNAGVTVVIVGISNHERKSKDIYSVSETGSVVVKYTDRINAYLVAGPNVIIEKMPSPREQIAAIDYGNKPTDDGNLILDQTGVNSLLANSPSSKKFIKRFAGSNDSIDGSLRFCLWINDDNVDEARSIPEISRRIEGVRKFRLKSTKAATVTSAKQPYKFQEVRQIGNESAVVIPRHSSENRPYLPFDLLPRGTIIADSAFAFYNAPLWNVAIFASKLHIVWIATVCGKIKTDYRYSNVLGWNTFPVPKLTDRNKADLTRCAENILLARETHFPSTIADLYEPDSMPEDLRRAHEENDEVLERIYIGKKFRNDTERLEKLFELYTKLVSTQPSKKKKGRTSA